VPASWVDRGNIIAQVLQVFEEGGLEAAQRLQAFCKAELEKIAAGH
jgi:hypothetical protein